MVFYIDILRKIYTHVGVKLYKRPIRFDAKWWLVAIWYLKIGRPIVRNRVLIYV